MVVMQRFSVSFLKNVQTKRCVYTEHEAYVTVYYAQTTYLTKPMESKREAAAAASAVVTTINDPMLLPMEAWNDRVAESGRKTLNFKE